MSLSQEDREFLALRFRRIERLIRMATQSEVDAITAELQAEAGPLADLLTAVNDLEAAVAAGQPVVDISGLRSAADATVAAIGSLSAAAAPPVATPTPAPVDVPPADSSTPA